MYKRLETILSFVEKGAIVADIGTDHAQLPILLVERNICNKVYACDEKKGPLSIAKENIKSKGLSDKIETILSDGFAHIPMDIDTAVIAGMGFYTAKMILENAQNRLHLLDKIIVQINVDSHLMRNWINENHYTILEEKYVNERNKDYEIISFTTQIEGKKLSEEEIYLGPKLMKEKSEEILAYYLKKEDKISSLLKLKKKQDEAYNELLRQYNILHEYNKKTC